MYDNDGFKERVREASDIVAIIGQYVTLKKRGKNITGLCPFHTEKTPSFTVHPDRQFFHCFGCGKGGDVFTFLMEHEGWSFPETLKYLAQKAGIPLPRRRAPDEADRYSRLLAANAAAAHFFAEMIAQPEGEYALKYITGRGVDKSKLKQWGIGYAPDRWDGLIKYCRRRDISEKELADAGLVVEREGSDSAYDRFRNRLTFAISNLSGRVVGFGARALGKDERAKYINSPETPLYRKSHILYGLDKAREAIRRADYTVVTEGYTDWIALCQAGITNVVASSGTAFTAEQARLLARFSKNVMLLFDADPAGQKAALRGVETLFREGLEVKIATLPAGSDPDTAIRGNGVDCVKDAIRGAKGYVQFRVDQSRDTLRSGGLLDRESVIKELLETASAVSDRIRRTLLVRQIAEATGIGENDLLAQMAPAGDTGRRTSPPSSGAAQRPQNRLEAEFLRLLLDDPSQITRVKIDVRAEDFRDKRLAGLYAELLALAPPPKEINPGDLGETPEQKSLWRQIAFFEFGPEVTGENLDKYVKNMTTERQREIIADLKRRIREAENKGNQDEANRLTRELSEKYLTKGQSGGNL